jgi:hypothetical protein
MGRVANQSRKHVSAAGVGSADVTSSQAVHNRMPHSYTTHDAHLSLDMHTDGRIRLQTHLQAGHLSPV